MKLRLGKWLVAGLLLAGLQVQAAESDPSEIRIGYQKAWCWRSHISYWRSVFPIPGLSGSSSLQVRKCWKR